MVGIKVALNLGLEILVHSSLEDGGFIGEVPLDCLRSAFSQGLTVRLPR